MKKIPKIWREFPKEERFKIPTRYFNIEEKTLERIRKIPDIRKRLIESAKIQYEMFKDIHSYLTVWIAGCGSDVAIREKFGSTQNLLNLFFDPIKFPANIKPSWQDIKRRIKVPGEMTEKLAEETGIHIGDGCLHIFKEKDTFHYRYSISGNLTDEYIYHKEHIANLMEEIYNIDPCLIKRKDKNCIESSYKSRVLAEFKNKILDLPIGNKTSIRIPKQILKDKKFQKRCVVGILDTDFNISSSLAITGKMNNLYVIKDMQKILKENNIPHKCRMYNKYGRFYIRKKGSIKIIEEWKLNNVKHTSKYNVVKEFGKFIPFSTTPERLAVLAGKLNIEDLEKICKKRASVKAL